MTKSATKPSPSKNPLHTPTEQDRARGFGRPRTTYSALAHIVTWNTVNRLCTKESKLLRGLASVESKLNLPPKTCIPRRAKMTMKRKRSRSREAMDWIELRREATRLERDRQYLKHGTERHDIRAATGRRT